MITFLNVFPYQNGISSDLIPVAIILGSRNSYYNKLRIPFRAYTQFYIGTTNSNKQRKLGVIALRPENEQVGYYVMSLTTGKKLHAFICTELIINGQVINRLNYLVTNEKQPDMTMGYPVFEWIPGIPIIDKGYKT